MRGEAQGGIMKIDEKFYHLFWRVIMAGLICVVFVFGFDAVCLANTVYMGPGETYKSLNAAFSAMSGGDTLIIRDGTYTGTDNQIRYNLRPPSGTAGLYTIVKAETPGRVKFDGQNARSMFWGFGTFNMSYVVFDGIQWVNSNNGHDLSGSTHFNRTAHHIKFTRCGFEDNIQINYASYILLEDCYVWGAGRYNFIAFTSDHVIFRRCVARLDAANGVGMPISNFVNYTSQYVEFQNCIAIDSSDDFYSNFEGIYGGFYIRKSNLIDGTWYNSADTTIRGSIVLNVKHDRWAVSSGEVLAIGFGANNLRFENSIFWDMNNGMVIDNSLDSNYVFDHCTFGLTAAGSFDDMLLGAGSYGDVSNSIFYRINGIALNDIKSSTRNRFYNNGTDKSSVGSSSGDITGIDPLWQESNPNGGLKYLLRIESEGSLSGAATDGGDIGATIVKKIGVSGTLWGESGYNTTTNEDLWPWPYEGIIADAFRTGVSDPPSNRGFCAPDQTLTKYIWEYLGNPAPQGMINYLMLVPSTPTGLRIIP
jgi:hypothetical protein